MTDAQRTELTFRHELWRSVCSGVLETAGSTFLLLIAVRWFHAGATAKALIAAGGSVGLMLSPVTVNLVQRWRWRASDGASRLFALGAVCSAIIAIFPYMPVFVVASIVAMTTTSAAIPLMTQIYQDNYPADQRGRLYSRAFMLRIAATILFGGFAGQLLTLRLELFRWLIVAFGVAFVVASWALRRIPSQPLHHPGGSHPLHAMRYVREDRMFRQTLIAWMLMGFANLSMLPMRVEYLANPKYGLAKTAAEISILTVVIPNLARLCLSPVWGWLFDRMNFFALRATLNLGFAIGILSFFTSNSTTGLVVAAVIFGISNAGGDVAWGLWVTKFASPERVADYMSVHTFLTGVRGVIAPFAAFHAVQKFSLPTLGWSAALLIAAASAFLVPEISRWKGGRKPDLVMEEVED